MVEVRDVLDPGQEDVQVEPTIKAGALLVLFASFFFVLEARI